MSAPFGLERCLSFINCQLQPPDRAVSFPEQNAGKCAVTISRQSGCGAHMVAERLARCLQAQAGPEERPWTVFDRNLVEQVLEDHQLPGRLARFMPEDRVPAMNDIMDELFGLRPPSWTLVQQTSETMLRLAELGNAIILGRGANIITAKLPHVLHVRLVGSLEQRIARMERFEGLSRKEAAKRVWREDVGRQRYLKKHFNRDVNDPLLYHLVINTDLVSLDDAARIIGDLALSRKAVPAA
jgi:cytidylate kinase